MFYLVCIVGFYLFYSGLQIVCRIVMVIRIISKMTVKNRYLFALVISGFDIPEMLSVF